MAELQHTFLHLCKRIPALSVYAERAGEKSRYAPNQPDSILQVPCEFCARIKGTDSTETRISEIRKS